MRYFVANMNKTWGRWIEAATGFEARKVVSGVSPGTFPRDFISIPRNAMDANDLAWAEGLTNDRH